MGFLDNLAKYNAAAGRTSEPAVNPPEAAKVLATETKAEVEGEAPKAAAAAAEPSAPTASGSAVQPGTDNANSQPAQEPKTRTRRSRSTSADVPPQPGNDPTLTQAIELVAMLLPSGTSITIPGRG